MSKNDSHNYLSVPLRTESPKAEAVRECYLNTLSDFSSDQDVSFPLENFSPDMLATRLDPAPVRKPWNRDRRRKAFFYTIIFSCCSISGAGHGLLRSEQYAQIARFIEEDTTLLCFIFPQAGSFHYDAGFCKGFLMYIGNDKSQCK